MCKDDPVYKDCVFCTVIILYILHIFISYRACYAVSSCKTTGHGYFSDSKFQPILMITFYTILYTINRIEHIIPSFTTMPQTTEQIS